MKLRLIKIGADMFDALHAYGLGIVVAHASGAPVDLSDEGPSYALSVPGDVPPARMEDVLAAALTLPDPDDVLAHDRDACARIAVAKANMDGLLAASYTAMGIRVFSLADLRSRQDLFPSSRTEASTKVRGAVARWTADATGRSRRATGRVEDMLRDYDADHPAIPLPAATHAGVRSVIPMGIDPSFSFASRRPLADGLAAHRTQVTVEGTRYAVALAVVGAARFLRGQRVAGNLVNLYIPLADHMTLARDTTLPPLPPAAHASRHAVASRWLAHARPSDGCDARWGGLAYQVIQPQAVQAPISRGRGRIDIAWLSTIEARGEGDGLIDRWRALLAIDDEHRPYDMDNLLGCLLDRRADAWMAHLRDTTMHRQGTPPSVYTLGEVREVSAAMTGSATVPLGDILRRPSGALRFGHALRQLGAYNTSAVRDVVADLDTVTTRDHLVRALARALQECAVASARNPFMIIPSDRDLEDLLDDIDRHGARAVASVLIILSTLRYPRASGDEAGNAPPAWQGQMSPEAAAMPAGDGRPEAADDPRPSDGERAE